MSRTFDIGFDKLATYDLCQSCSELPNFEDYIVTEQKLSAVGGDQTADGVNTPNHEVRSMSCLS